MPSQSQLPRSGGKREYIHSYLQELPCPVAHTQKNTVNNTKAGRRLLGMNGPEKAAQSVTLRQGARRRFWVPGFHFTEAGTCASLSSSPTQKQCVEGWSSNEGMREWINESINLLPQCPATPVLTKTLPPEVLCSSLWITTQAREKETHNFPHWFHNLSSALG